MEEPMISVIMPVYNCEKYLSAAIDSVLSQNFDDYELVIVDDGSTDASYEIIKRYEEQYPDRISTFHQENKGAFPAYNKCAELARGKYILPLNSDDKFYDGCLETVGGFIREYGVDVVFVNVSMDFCDDDQNITREHFQQTAMDRDFVITGKRAIEENWANFMRRGLVKNNINAIRSDILKRHPYKASWYGSDFLLNIEIADEITSAACSAKNLYQFFVYSEGERNLSMGKYNDYEHEMFNTFYDRYWQLFHKWGLANDENLKLIQNMRIRQLETELQNIFVPTCTLSGEARIMALASYLDETVSSAAIGMDKLLNVHGSILDRCAAIQEKYNVPYEKMDYVGILFQGIGESKNGEYSNGLNMMADAIGKEHNRNKLGLAVYGLYIEELENANIGGLERHKKNLIDWYEIEICKAYINSQQFDLALPLIENLGVSPRSAEVYSLLGCFYFYVGDMGNSLRYLEEGLAEYPSNEDIIQNLLLVKEQL